MNLSRVIGPVIGGLIFAALDAGPVFAINAVTYVFAVIGLVWAQLPAVRARARSADRREHRLLDGVRIARRRPGDQVRAADAVLVLVLLGHVRRASCPSSRKYNLGVTEGLVRAALRDVRPRRGRGRAHGRARCSPTGRRWRCLRPGFVALRDRARGLRPGPQRPRARSSSIAVARLHVLPRHHVPVDDPAEAVARRATRSGHGVVDHGLRRNRPAGCARRRALRQVVLDRGAARRGRLGVGARVCSSARSLRAKGAPDD